MIIVCLGYADKRPVIYALIKLLQSFGDVAVITQNRQLQRLLEGRSTSGHYNNTFIAISDSRPDTTLIEKGYSTSDFDHLIYDSIDVLPEKYDVCIHCRSFVLTEIDREILNNVIRAIKYNFVYDSKSLNDCVNIPVTFPLVKSVEEFEALKLLVPMQSDIMLKSLSKLTSPYLKADEKDILKILKRRWNEK